jgi:hypothetical protein
VGAENATRVVQLCDCLCRQNGLRGRRIAADLLHITLRGVGAYDGLPNFIIERACEAGATGVCAIIPLLYDSRVVRELRIEPILVDVRDFVLVHSMIGQQKHIELARWPLRG